MLQRVMLVMMVVVAGWASRALADCQVDADCKNGRVCVDYSCQKPPSCQADSDCPGALVCGKNNKCAPASPSGAQAEPAPAPAPEPDARSAPSSEPPVALPAPAAAPASTERTRPHAGEMGIQVSLPAGGDATLGFSYFVAPTGSLRVDLGFDITSVQNAAQAFSLEVGYRLYFAKFDHFMPFVEPGLWVGNPGSVFTIAFEGGVGGEYFITDHFSFGAETGIAVNVNVPPDTGAVVTFKTGTSAIFGEFLW